MDKYYIETPEGFIQEDLTNGPLVTAKMFSKQSEANKFVSDLGVEEFEIWSSKMLANPQQVLRGYTPEAAAELANDPRMGVAVLKVEAPAEFGGTYYKTIMPCWADDEIATLRRWGWTAVRVAA